MPKHRIFMPDKKLAGVISLSRQEESVLTGLRLSQRVLTATAFVAIKLIMEQVGAAQINDPIKAARDQFFALRGIPAKLLDEAEANTTILLQIGVLTQIGLLGVHLEKSADKDAERPSLSFPLSERVHAHECPSGDV